MATLIKIFIFVVGAMFNFKILVGQKVSWWDVITTIGNTGRSNGPYFHYEVRVNGVPKDSSYYLLEE